MHTVQATATPKGCEGKYYNVIFFNNSATFVIKHKLPEKEAFAWCNYLNGGAGQPFNDPIQVETTAAEY